MRHLRADDGQVQTMKVTHESVRSRSGHPRANATHNSIQPRFDGHEWKPLCEASANVSQTGFTIAAEFRAQPQPGKRLRRSSACSR